MQIDSGPVVDLVDHTPYPLETMYSFWHASRTDAPTLTAKEIHGAYTSSKRFGEKIAPRFWTGGYAPGWESDEPFHEYFDREMMAIAGIDFPLKETIIFSFVFSNVTITWREQAVRQRRATFWSQTSRMRDLGNFVDEGWYSEPASVAAIPELHEEYHTVILSIQDFYRHARAAGVHQEDARCLQPTSQTHRIAGAYNARILEMALEDRICFIGQQELWKPVVFQMREHVMRVDPRLGVLFHPPCIKGDKYRYCPVEHENERRLDGRDPHGPCPLWLMQQGIPWNGAPNQEEGERQWSKMSGLWNPKFETAVDLYMAARG
jgi:thymidylate synthase ThyX